MHRFVTIILAVTVFSLTATDVRSAPPEAVFEHYSSLDGLPHNSISDIYKDSKGFIWICTWYGLSRFDGYTFKNYRTLPGDRSPLSHNRFLRIEEDSSGFLWLLTYDNHLYRFNRHNEVFEELDGVRDETGNYKADQFFCSSRGNTWIALHGRGVVCTQKPQGETMPQVTSFIGHPQVGRTVTGITEDELGRIFVISEKGLTLFTHEGEGFRAKLVAEGGPWAGIAQSDGNVYYGSNQRVTAIDPDNNITWVRELPVQDRITAVEVSPDGRTVYAGTWHSGIYEIDTRTTAVQSQGTLAGRVRSMTADSRGTVWITTDREGITRYDPSRRDYRHYLQEVNAVSYYIDTLTRVVEAGGRVWIKMNKAGFGYYDRDRDTVEPFYNTSGERFTNGVPCFWIDDTNVLWMSTSSRALEKITIIEQMADVFVPGGDPADPASAEIRALMLDSRGNVWMGNKAGGLFCYSPRRELLFSLPDRVSGPIEMIYTLKEDDRGNIWVGTKGDGVLRLSFDADGSHTVKRFRHDAADPCSLSNDQIYSIEQDAKGRMWFGSYAGGISMLPDPDSDNFITTAASFPNYPDVYGEKVRYMHMIPDGTMMVGTVEGVIMFDPDEDPAQTRFEIVGKIPGDATSLGNNDVIQILTDSRGRVWLCTFGGGLNLYEGRDDEGKPCFRVFSEEQGLASNIVFAVTEDQSGDIWVSTENGLSKLDPERGTFSNYSRYDGVPQATFSEATAVTAPDGYVLFGSTGNLFVVNPSAITPSVGSSRLTFTNLEVDNREVAVGGDSPLSTSIVEAREITLPYDYSVFRIEFAALNYRLQPKLIYEYKLEGYDREWTRVNNTRSVSYSNVPHGSYVFRVKCLPGEGVVSDDEISIAVGIAPPPWKSWWAYLIYAVLAILLAVLVVRILYTVISLRNKVNVERKMTDLKLRFFTNISHELRTPLTLILGSVEDVARREDLTQRGENNISLARKNAKRMLSLINQILDFRKVVNEKMELKVRYVDIIPVAQGVMDDFREVGSERGIELLFAVSARQLMVWVDPRRIEGVIYNLLSNAFKFTPDGGRIELSVSHKDGDGDFVISVSDSGKGIPKDKQDAIFERFTQVTTAVEGQPTGTGIGLALSKEVVELHHGAISVDSRPGGGATFTVKLPMGNSHFSMDQIDFAGGDKAYSGTGEYSSDQPRGADRMRVDRQPPADAPLILLVEDNQELRVFIYNQLIESYRVEEAADGREALEKIAANPPDIVITDLMMPRMDGIELTEAIRGDFNTSHIPIIILTARSETDVRTRAMRYGADGYIAKPFSMDLLEARIENLLTQRRKLFERFSDKRAKVVDLSPGEIVVTDRDEEFIRSVMSWIDDNLDNPELTIDMLASHLGMGRTTMYNKIKGLTGKSPVEIIKEYRVTKAMMLLRSGQFAVSEAAYKVGFSDPGYFSKCFKEQYKMSPAEFVKNNRK